MATAPVVFDDQSPVIPIGKSAGPAFDDSSPLIPLPKAAVADPVAPQQPQVTQQAAQPQQLSSRLTGQDTMQAAPQPGLLERARESVANSMIGRSLQSATPGLASALHLQPTETEAEQQRTGDQQALPRLPEWANTPVLPYIQKGIQIVNRAADPYSYTEEGRKIRDQKERQDAQARALYDLEHPIQAGISKAINEAGEGLTTPANIALLAAAPESKILSAVFAAQAAKGSYDSAKKAEEDYQEGKNPEAQKHYREVMDAFSGALGGPPTSDADFQKAWEYHQESQKGKVAGDITSAILSAGMAGLAGYHALKGEFPVDTGRPSVSEPKAPPVEIPNEPRLLTAGPRPDVEFPEESPTLPLPPRAAPQLPAATAGEAPPNPQNPPPPFNRATAITQTGPPTKFAPRPEIPADRGMIVDEQGNALVTRPGLPPPGETAGRKTPIIPKAIPPAVAAPPTQQAELATPAVMAHPAGRVTGIDQHSGLPIVDRTTVPEAVAPSPEVPTAISPASPAAPAAALASPTSGARPVVQASTDPAAIHQSAEEQKPHLEKNVQAVADQVPGAEVEGIRVKSPESVENKEDRGKHRDAIIDHLGVRVSVPTAADVPAMQQQIESKLPVVSKEKITNNGVNADQYGIQTGAPGEPNQVSELQVVTKPVADAMKETDELYAQQKKLQAQADSFKKGSWSNKRHQELADAIGDQIRTKMEAAQKEAQQLENQNRPALSESSSQVQLGNPAPRTLETMRAEQKSLRTQRAAALQKNLAATGEQNSPETDALADKLEALDREMWPLEREEMNDRTAKQREILRQFPESELTPDELQILHPSASPFARIGTDTPHLNQPSAAPAPLKAGVAPAAGPAQPSAAFSPKKGDRVQMADGRPATVTHTVPRRGMVGIKLDDGRAFSAVPVSKLQPAQPVVSPTAAQPQGAVAPVAEGATATGTPRPIGKPLMKRVDQIKELVAKGQKVVIFSVEADNPEIRQALQSVGLGALPVTDIKGPDFGTMLDNQVNVQSNVDAPMTIPPIPAGKALYVDFDGTLFTQPGKGVQEHAELGISGGANAVAKTEGGGEEQHAIQEQGAAAVGKQPGGEEGDGRTVSGGRVQPEQQGQGTAREGGTAKEEKPLERPGGGEKPEEVEPTKYKHGNTQADIPPDSDAGKALARMRRAILPEDLAGDGMVTDAHITVRYGIDSEDTAGIRAYLEKQAPFEATLGKTQAFPPSEHSDGAAPIIVPVESADLRRMEKEIDQHGKFVERSFPEFKPHATLAYVKPEEARRYTGMTEADGKKFTVSSVTISKKDGSTEEVQLKGKAKPSFYKLTAKPTPQVAPAKSPKPSFSIKSKKQMQADKDYADKLAEHFKPGNIIWSSYWNSFDKVLSFEPSTPDKGWLVNVIKTDKEGNPEANERPRRHSTYPDAKDKIVGHVSPVAIAEPAVPKSELPTPKIGDMVTVRLGGRDYPNTMVTNIANGKYGVDVFGFKYVDRSDIVDVKPKNRTIPTVQEQIALNKEQQLGGPKPNESPKVTPEPKLVETSAQRFKKAVQAKSDKYLDTQVRRETGQVVTRREIINERMAGGGTTSIKEVRDEAAERKLDREIGAMRKAGVPTGNEMHPKTIKYREMLAQQKAGIKVPSYRITSAAGETWIVPKTEYDYAKSIEGKESPSTQPQPKAGNPSQVEIMRADSQPVLDIHGKPTGWLQFDSTNARTLVHPTENTIVRFESKDWKSGTALLRAKAEAQAYAVDHPVEKSEPKPAGELIVKPIFGKGEARTVSPETLVAPVKTEADAVAPGTAPPTRLEELKRQSDALAKEEEQLKEEKGTTTTKPTGTTLYSNPMFDPAAYRRFILDPLSDMAAPLTDALERYIGEARTAEDIQKGLVYTERAQRARQVRVIQTIERLLKKDGFTPADGKQVYRHIEDPAVKLTPKQAELRDKWIVPLNQAARQQYTILKLIQSGKFPIEDILSGKISKADIAKYAPLAEGYMHRIAAGHNTQLDRIVAGKTKGFGGNKSVLSRALSSAKHAVFQEAHSPTGQREVVAIKGGRVRQFVNTANVGVLDAKIADLQRDVQAAKTERNPSQEKIDRIQNQVWDLKAKRAQVESDGIATIDLGAHKSGYVTTDQLADEAVKPLERRLDAIKSEERTLRATPSRMAAAAGRLRNIAVDKADLERQIAAVRASVGPEQASESGMRADEIMAERLRPVQKIIDRLTEEQQKLNATRSRTPAQERRIVRIGKQLKELENQKGDIEDQAASEGLQGSYWRDKYGSLWKFNRGTTEFISSRTGQKYYDNAILSSTVNYLDTARAAQAAATIETQKSSLEREGLLTREVDPSKIPDGWKGTQLMQMRGLSFPPHIADAYDQFAEKMSRGTPDILDQINQFNVQMVLMNPLMHGKNVVSNWVTGKLSEGVASGRILNPVRYVANAKAGIRALNAVWSLNEDYLHPLENGLDLLRTNPNFDAGQEELVRSLVDHLELDKETMSAWKKALSLPGNGLDALRHANHTATFGINDLFTLQAYYSALDRFTKDGNPDPEGAARDWAHRQVVEYRPPVRFMGSRAAEKTLENPKLSAFWAYHSDLLRQIATAIGDASGTGFRESEAMPGKNEFGQTPAQARANGLAKLAVMAAIAAALYPLLLDPLAKQITGDERGKAPRGGLTGLASNIYESAKGERDWSATATGVFTPALGTENLMEMISNRDFFTGRHLRGTEQDFQTQAKQLGDWLGKRSMPGQLAGRIDQGQGKQAMLSLLGFTFPMEHGLKEAAEIRRDKAGSNPPDPQNSKVFQSILAAAEQSRRSQGNDTRLADALEASGKLSKIQERELEEAILWPPIVFAVNGMAPEEVYRVFEKSTDDERRELLNPEPSGPSIGATGTHNVARRSLAKYLDKLSVAGKDKEADKVQVEFDRYGGAE